MQSYRAGVLAIAVAGVMWSLMGLAFRNIEAASVWQILFYRSLGTTPVLFAFIAWRSGGHPLQRVGRAGWAGVIGGLGLVLAFTGAMIAFKATTIANAVFLFAASPFLAAILAWVLLREPVRLVTRLAIGLALVGIVIMVREGLAAGAMAGNAAALLSALGFAGFTVSLRWGKLEDMMPAVMLGAVFSMLVAWPMAALEGDALRVSLQDGAIAVAMGALLVGLGMVLYTLGSRVVPAAEATLISLIEVMLAPIWVRLVLGETASSGTFVGGGIVLAAIMVNALSGVRRTAPA